MKHREKLRRTLDAIRSFLQDFEEEIRGDCTFRHLAKNISEQCDEAEMALANGQVDSAAAHTVAAVFKQEDLGARLGNGRP